MGSVVDERHKIVIVGSGFSGLGMGIALKKAGLTDFVILEKSADLGGTWRDNQYPGCACDVPSPLYSFSFELNASWSQLFAPRAEISEYLHDCSAKYGIDEHMRYGSEVESMEWDDAAELWTVRTPSGDRYVAHAVISGAGALHIPSYPKISGFGSFEGPAFHSSEWDKSCDLAGKRVAVIGTGASAIQIIPEIAKVAGQVTVFQRTPPWIQPRPNAPIPERTRRLLDTVPGTARGLRYAVYWMLETRAVGVAVDPRLMAPLEALSRKQLERQVADPALRARLTPDYTIGCKRILLSSDYYPALQRPNVELVTEDIAEIVPTGVRTSNGSGNNDGGTLREFDVLIY